MKDFQNHKSRPENVILQFELLMFVWSQGINLENVIYIYEVISCFCMADLKNVNYIFKVDHGITSIMYRIRHIRAWGWKISGGVSCNIFQTLAEGLETSQICIVWHPPHVNFTFLPPPLVTGKSPGLARNIPNIGWGLGKITNMHCLAPSHVNFTFSPLPPPSCNRKITGTSLKYSKHWLRASKHHKYALFGNLTYQFYISPFFL